MKLHYQPPPSREIIPPAFRQLGRKRRKWRKPVAMVVSLGTIGFLAWIWWWHHKQPSKTQRNAPVAPATQPSPSVAARPASSPISSTSLPITNVAPPGALDRDLAAQVQIALIRFGISPGPVDGIMGPQTHVALLAFQKQQLLGASGQLDAATRQRLNLNSPANGHALTNYPVNAEDLSRLRPLGPTWLAKSLQDRLDYETVLELVAEKTQSHQDLIWRLNPNFDWRDVRAGATLTVPNARFPAPKAKAVTIRISLADRTLEIYDGENRLMAHFPCSIGRLAEKRPVGSLHITTIAPDPNYTFDPAVFPDSDEARQLDRKLILQPGPNNPVGAVWIGLDKPGYGIHGTPQPEKVGRTESHGCFRLANWNAEYLMKFAWVGMPVDVEE